MSAPAIFRRALVQRPAFLLGARLSSSSSGNPPSTGPAPSGPASPARSPPPNAYAGLLGYLTGKTDVGLASAASELDLQALVGNPFGLPAQEEEYKLSIYSHKHNTHITFCDPQGKALISVSTGNLGFRKGNRGSYDAAYQLAAHVFRFLEDEKRVRPKALEVVLRGFGQGRDAVTKALLGQEGRFLRPAVTRVTDSTRLKFGGTRSPRPRRLG